MVNAKIQNEFLLPLRNCFMCLFVRRQEAHLKRDLKDVYNAGFCVHGTSIPLQIQICHITVQIGWHSFKNIFI